MSQTKLFEMPFSRTYPLYIEKAQRKGRSKDEVDQIIFWLCGYNKTTLALQLEANTRLDAFFQNAPAFHPNATQIKGLICGHRVEDIEDETMQKIRYLDKLIDELARGKSMEQILRK